MKEFVQLPLISVSLQNKMIQFFLCSGIENFLCSLFLAPYFPLLFYYDFSSTDCSCPFAGVAFPVLLQLNWICFNILSGR